jgi:hypothetical protein
MARTDKQRFAVAERAVEAVDARTAGATEVILGNGGTRQSFDLDEGGMCNRFVRQCVETALGLVPFTWAYRGATAKATLAKLEAAGKRVPLADRQIGDILGIEMAGPGHIVIYLGNLFDPNKELVAENTSAHRGFPRPPGTKVTSFASLKSRITGCYRP